MSIAGHIVIALVRERIPRIESPSWRAVGAAGYFTCRLDGAARTVLCDRLLQPLWPWTDEFVARHVVRELVGPDA